METTTHAGLTLAVALAAGVVAQSAARHLRLPGIVVLLALGAALGPDGIGWVEPEALGAGLFGLVDFAVAVILFEGGLNLKMSRLRRQEAAIRRLITVGALVTLAGAGGAAMALLGWPWERALLFGSLVVVTGPTVINPLLRDMRLRPHLRTVLEAEGVLIDPIGAFLAVLALDIALVPAAGTLASSLLDITLRLGFGIAAGVAGGLAVGLLLHGRRAIPHGYENIFALSSVILLFQASDLVVSYSGILAVTIAGVVVGNMDTRVDRDLREFKDQLTIMLVGLIFILLAADIRLDDVRALGWPGLLVVALLVLVVRPLDAWVSTRRSNLSARERAFIAWVAPRGIVAAAVSSLTAVAMDASGVPGGGELRALVFLTIGVTVVLAGLTARPLASILGLRLPRRDRVAILGAQGLGFALAGELRGADVPVVFLDSDPARCRNAEEAGFAVIFGDALDERTLLRAQFELVGASIGLTANDHLNSLFVAQARTLFQVPKGYVALNALGGERAPKHVERHEGDMLFEGPHDVERWDVRWRHNDVVIERLEYRPEKERETPRENDRANATPNDTAGERREGGPGSGAEAARGAGGNGRGGLARPGERHVVLAIRRDRRLVPMHLGYRIKEGDVASVALYRAERDEALAQLAEAGWRLRQEPPETDARASA